MHRPWSRSTVKNGRRLRYPYSLYRCFKIDCSQHDIPLTMYPTRVPQTCKFYMLALRRLHLFGILLLCFWSHTSRSAPSLDLEYQPAGGIVASLTNSSVIQTQITQGLNSLRLHDSLSGNDTQVRVARAKLACYISNLILGNVGIHHEGYVDQSKSSEYLNRTEANW